VPSCVGPGGQSHYSYAYGLMVHYALEAAERVASEGIVRGGPRPSGRCGRYDRGDPAVVGAQDRQRA